MTEKKSQVLPEEELEIGIGWHLGTAGRNAASIHFCIFCEGNGVAGRLTTTHFIRQTKRETAAMSWSLKQRT